MRALRTFEEALRRVEEDRVEAEQLELVVGDVQLVLGVLLSRVGDPLDLRSRDLRDELGDVTHARGLRHLVEDLDRLAGRGRVRDGELDAAARIGDVDERARLPAGAVDGQRDVAGGLHEEAVEDGPVLAVVIEAVAQLGRLRCQRRVRAPDDALVQVGEAE